MKKAKDQPESEPAELASLVGERIRKIRKEEGLSLKLFALRCDMNAAYVGHIERGIQNPTLNTLERICKGLDISVEDLFIDMLFTDVQRSVRLNKKKKSTNTSPYPDEVIDRLARAFYPAILACWNSEEGQREFAAWQAEQAHNANNEKQEVPAGELPVVHIAIVCGLLQGASYSGAHPVFCFALNLLAHGSRLRFSSILLDCRSESNPHSPVGHCK